MVTPNTPYYHSPTDDEFRYEVLTAMYLRRFTIENIRSISHFEMEFEKDEEAGWHVILGSNGAGKSSIVRSLALLFMGEKEAYAARQDFSNWIARSEEVATISGLISMSEAYDTLDGGGQPPKRNIAASVRLERQPERSSRRAEAVYAGERVNRTIWGEGAGWFSSSFGPFRRFTGGDRLYDRLFVSNKRLAPHLTALGEDVALTEALDWLASLHVRGLQDDRAGRPSEASEILILVKTFLNETGFFPHGATVEEVTDTNVIILDGNGTHVPMDQLSDGYRSALSMTLELIRQMFSLYGVEVMRRALTEVPGTIMAPGVVAIDEVDAHLHPTWQRDIGRWMTKRFPKIQFIVTTHSPIVCRAVASEEGVITGGVWKLPAPGSSGGVERISGVELNQLVFGDVLDAYDTDLFGSDITRSKAGSEMVARLAFLNAEALKRDLLEVEVVERRKLRAIFPAEAGSIPLS